VKLSLPDWKKEELKNELHKIDKELTLEALCTAIPNTCNWFFPKVALDISKGKSALLL
jgi:hypothetical protein